MPAMEHPVWNYQERAAAIDGLVTVKEAASMPLYGVVHCLMPLYGVAHCSLPQYGIGFCWMYFGLIQCEEYRVGDFFRGLVGMNFVHGNGG